LLSYLETGNKQVRIAEWNYFSYRCLTIIAELIEFLFWHVLLFIFSCCLNLKWCRGYSVHFFNKYDDDNNGDDDITCAALPYLPGLLQSLNNKTPIISSGWLYELKYA
jgi:hypothetical protein